MYFAIARSEPILAGEMITYVQKAGLVCCALELVLAKFVGIGILKFPILEMLRRSRTGCEILNS
jgi:hypothetical protein